MSSKLDIALADHHPAAPINGTIQMASNHNHQLGTGETNTNVGSTVTRTLSGASIL